MTCSLLLLRFGPIYVAILSLLANKLKSPFLRISRRHESVPSSRHTRLLSAPGVRTLMIGDETVYANARCRARGAGTQVCTPGWLSVWSCACFFGRLAGRPSCRRFVSANNPQTPAAGPMLKQHVDRRLSRCAGARSFPNISGTTIYRPGEACCSAAAQHLLNVLTTVLVRRLEVQQPLAQPVHLAVEVRRLPLEFLPQGRDGQ